MTTRDCALATRCMVKGGVRVRVRVRVRIRVRVRVRVSEHGRDEDEIVHHPRRHRRG